MAPSPAPSHRAEPQIPISYHADDGETWDTAYSNHVPVAGQYVFWGPQAYVVDEVWDIWEKHGAHQYGHHVFLTTVDVMETRLGKSDPRYYGSSKG